MSSGVTHTGAANDETNDVVEQILKYGPCSYHTGRLREKLQEVHYDWNRVCDQCNRLKQMLPQHSASYEAQLEEVRTVLSRKIKKLL